MLQNHKLEELNTYIGAIFRNCYIDVSYDAASEIFISVYVNLDNHKTPLELCGTGMLQVIQIMAYSLYFNPKLLLLDEPDEHLHPDNQILLCNAIRSLVDHFDLQILITTHSRHMIAELEDDANFIWMKNEKVSEEKISSNYYNVLVDLGALDLFDKALNGKYKRIIFTEDTNTKYLKVLLEVAGYSADDILVESYGSCSRLEEVAYLASFIKGSAKECKIVVHIDRDFMTDYEIDYVTRNVKKSGIDVWVTDGADIESYFVKPAHIAALTGKTDNEAKAWIDKLIHDNQIEVQHKFEEKRNEIKYRLYYNEKFKGNDEITLPKFEYLFGSNINTENVLGKILLRKCNGDMKNFCGRTCNLVKPSEALEITSLKEILK